jgi:hypothetical protein
LFKEEPVMANQHYSGTRNRPAHEDRASWSPTSDDAQRSDRGRDRDDDRWASDRSRASYTEQDTGNMGRDRDATESYGQGQSGYSAGRSGEDRSQSYQNRNQSYPSGGSGGYSGGGYQGGNDDRQPGRSGMGLDDRFSGRGGADWGERTDYQADRSGNYGSERGRDTGYRSSRMDTGGDGRGGGYGGSSSGGYGYPRGMRDDRGMGGYRGKGPQHWQRSDERIRETVNEALADNDYVDATYIQVTVKDGEVTLSGTVEDRRMKRLAEDCVEQVSGVKEVQNQLRIQSPDTRPTGGGHGNSRTGSTPSPQTSDDKKARA